MSNTTTELPKEIIAEFVGVAHGDFEKVRVLLAEHPSLVNCTAPWGETPLGAAAHTGHREIAEYLLANGAPLDICTAAMLGKTETVSAMLEAEPGLAHATGAHEFPVLFYPMIHGYRQLAELLLERGADPNAGEGRMTPIHAAVLFRQPRMVEWLIANGARVNPLNYDAKTPLRMALDQDQAELAELLRKHGGVEQLS